MTTRGRGSCGTERSKGALYTSLPTVQTPATPDTVLYTQAVAEGHGLSSLSLLEHDQKMILEARVAQYLDWRSVLSILFCVAKS